jgi:hypothetical protein
MQQISVAKQPQQKRRPAVCWIFALVLPFATTSVYLATVGHGSYDERELAFMMVQDTQDIRFDIQPIGEDLGTDSMLNTTITNNQFASALFPFRPARAAILPDYKPFLQPPVNVRILLFEYNNITFRQDSSKAKAMMSDELHNIASDGFARSLHMHLLPPVAVPDSTVGSDFVIAEDLSKLTVWVVEMRLFWCIKGVCPLPVRVAEAVQNTIALQDAKVNAIENLIVVFLDYRDRYRPGIRCTKEWQTLVNIMPAGHVRLVLQQVVQKRKVRVSPSVRSLVAQEKR